MAGTDFVTEGQVDSLVTNIATAVKSNTTALGNHLSDAADAHDASAISVLDAATQLTATDVEAALAEIYDYAETKTDDGAVTTHINDTDAAHAASAISVADVATQLTATDVEAALAEIYDYAETKTDDGAVTTHINDTDDAHDASAISVADVGTLYTATDVEAALAEVKGIADAAATTSALSDHINDTGDAHDASAISVLDSGDHLTATDVEAALAEIWTIADGAAGGGVTINDAATNTTQAWSSDKITSHVSTAVSDLVNSAPAALDTLDELAAALGDDANFASTTATALGNRLRIDAAQGLDGTQKAQGLSNLGIVASSVDFAANFNTAIA